MRLHRWGVQFGSWSIVWWDLWAHSLCWEVSRVRSTPDPSEHRSTGTGWPA